MAKTFSLSRLLLPPGCYVSRIPPRTAENPNIRNSKMQPETTETVTAGARGAFRISSCFRSVVRNAIVPGQLPFPCSRSRFPSPSCVANARNVDADPESQGRLSNLRNPRAKRAAAPQISQAMKSLLT